MDDRHDFGPPRDVTQLLSLEGKVALVTGGAGLYGSGISAALAEAGAKTIIASRNLETCDKKAQELRDRGLDALAAQVDLSQEESIADLAAWIENEIGQLDILFNNAVSRSVGGDFGTVTAEQWADTMVVNSTSLLLSTRYLAEIIATGRPDNPARRPDNPVGQCSRRPIPAQNTGSIVNIASIYGMVGPQFDIYRDTDMQNPAEYAFAKGGMIQLTRYLAAFYAPQGIRVNAISPGGYFTGQPEPFVKEYCERTPLGRMAGEEDIKGVAVFLASDASAYITGANIPLEGGWTAW